ncbi:MAG: sulfite exporter TauE/SafE family protein [Burkholderiales bacterium]|nr:sulfite exporter TauE/SafE family protein [Burkholderiales bacterium]
MPIAVAASFIYGVAGFGAGLLTVPIASHFLDLRFVLAVFCLLDAVMATRLLAERPREIDRSELLRLVPCCLVGVVLGVVLLGALPAQALMLALGGFCLVYGVVSLALPAAMPMIGHGWAWLAGVTGGITSALFGAGGPPYAIYLSMRPHSAVRMRATLAATSVFSIGARIVAFAAAGMLADAGVWLTALAVVPASLIAMALARRLADRLSRDAVLRVVRVLLCVAGVSLIVRAVISG